MPEETRRTKEEEAERNHPVEANMIETMWLLTFTVENNNNENVSLTTHK